MNGNSICIVHLVELIYTDNSTVCKHHCSGLRVNNAYVNSATQEARRFDLSQESGKFAGRLLLGRTFWTPSIARTQQVDNGLTSNLRSPLSWSVVTAAVRPTPDEPLPVVLQYLHK
jgi:hypothetical protein